MAKARSQEGCELNMTPMIDIVFQLIIFFVVTVALTNNRNEDIKLAWTPHGTPIDNQGDKAAEQMTLVVEVDSKGRVSISNIPMTYTQLQDVVRRRRLRFHNAPPIMVRADYQTQHRYLKPVLDICTAQGQGRISFVAIHDPRTDDSKKRFSR